MVELYINSPIRLHGVVKTLSVPTSIVIIRSFFWSIILYSLVIGYQRYGGNRKAQTTVPLAGVEQLAL
jgi:hypothetical protein